jgi:MFS superfamily sulfate permease-like transporter
MQWAKWFPFLRWQRPNALLLRNETIAAFTVTIILIPQAVAYAALAGMPLATGLYASLLPALVSTVGRHQSLVGGAHGFELPADCGIAPRHGTAL